MAKNYGTVTHEGNAYRLIEDAWCADEGGKFKAIAVRVGEQPDELGYRNTYIITWSILDDWDGEDGGEACDWDNPDSVEDGEGMRPDGSLM